MAIVKISLTLQTPTDVDALLVKRGVTVKAGLGAAKGYELDVQGSSLLLVSWDSALGATPTQQEIDALGQNDRTAAVTAQKVAIFKTASRTKDRLADFAAMRMAVNLVDWNKLTGPQQIAAVLADADAWLTVRQAIESAVP